MKIAATWLLLAAGAAQAQAQIRPDQAAFRELFRELVETNTTLSSGSCTLAAERMAARLKAAGFTDSQLTLFTTPEHPKEGGLVAIYPGTSTTAKPILLIAHIASSKRNARTGSATRSPCSRRTATSTPVVCPT